MRIEIILRILSAWGKGQPLIKAIYIFGSRSRNDYGPDSDLDIGVALDLKAEDDGLSEWMSNSEEWRRQLRQLLPYKIQLEWYAGQLTPTIENGIEKSSILAYSKGT